MGLVGQIDVLEEVLQHDVAQAVHGRVSASDRDRLIRADDGGTVAGLRGGVGDNDRFGNCARDSLRRAGVSDVLSGEGQA